MTRARKFTIAILLLSGFATLSLVITNKLNAYLLAEYKARSVPVEPEHDGNGVFGKINGQSFVMDGAIYNMDMKILTLRQGSDFFADRELEFFLFDNEKTSFSVTNGNASSPVHVYVSWKQTGQSVPATETFMSGDISRLNLNFLGINDTHILGTIDLEVDTELPTKVKGNFIAKLKNKKGATSENETLVEVSPVEQIKKMSVSLLEEEFTGLQVNIKRWEYYGTGLYNENFELDPVNGKQRGRTVVVFDVNGSASDIREFRFLRTGDNWVVERQTGAGDASMIEGNSEKKWKAINFAELEEYVQRNVLVRVRVTTNEDIQREGKLVALVDGRAQIIKGTLSKGLIFEITESEVEKIEVFTD